MTDATLSKGSVSSKLGWILILAASAVLVLNGIGWMFVGGNLGTFEEDTGVSLTEFQETYPSVAESIATNARQVSIWFIAFGLLSFVVAWRGFRRRDRWAWSALWILAAAPAAVGLNVFVGGESSFGLALMGFAAVVAVALLLAGRQASPP